MVMFASIALAFTGPGQTVGLSVFVDPLITDLQISRTSLTVAYMIGTLVGATALPSIGRGIDRFGVRKAMALIGLVFGSSLLAISLVSGITGVTLGFVMLRMMGQGALSVAATTVIASWFLRRRGLALGIVGASGAIGITLTPLIANQLIFAFGWRAAWQIQGLAVLVVIVPLAAFLIRNRPADIGQVVDGHNAISEQMPATPSVSAAAALRTSAFWIIAAVTTMSATLSTAVAFHQVGLLTSRGLTPTAAAANFIPQVIATLVAVLAVGALADRLHARWIISSSMVALTAGLFWGLWVSPGWSAIVFGVLIGFSSGVTRIIETVELPKYFGLAHLGAIRGRVTGAAIAGSALGPVGFAFLQETTGNFAWPLFLAGLLPIPLALAALRLKNPPKA